MEVPNNILNGVLQNVLNNFLAGNRCAIRKEIPFDNWFYRTSIESQPNNNRDNSIKGKIDLAESALLGSAYGVMETVKYIFSLFFKPREANAASKAAKDQFYGAYLCLVGIYSPTLARNKFLDIWRDSEAMRGQQRTFIFVRN